MPNAGRLGLAMKAGPAGLLHSACDAIKYLDAFNGILSDRGLTAQHDRVRLLEDGVRYISDFCARRNWIFDHRLEHVGSDDYLSTRLNAPHHVRRWMIGSSSIGHSMPRSPRAIMIASHFP